MKIYKYKYSLWGFLSFMTLTILSGLEAFRFCHWVLVFVFFTFLIMALTYKFGIEITQDFMFRRFHSVFGQSFGHWEKLPEIQYLSVVRVRQYRYRITGVFIDQERTNKKFYQVNMIFDNNKHKKLLSGNKTIAIKYAIEVARYLNLKLLDFTTPGKKGLISTDDS